MTDDDAREARGSPGASQEDAAVSKELGGLSIGGRQTLPEPSGSRPIGDGVVAVDITDRFIAAASTLEQGELIKEPFFTLFESVGALEIMDPKMDSGCLPAEELEDDDYDLARPLQPEDVIGIVDQLLCLEMAWHLGYPLSQTILTSAYVCAMLSPAPTALAKVDFVQGRSPQELSASTTHVLLRAYCVGLIKTCGLVIEEVKNQVFFEEEDFVTNTFHLSLLEGVTLEETRAVLQEARSIALDAKDGWPEDIALALEARLAFREYFLEAIELAELRMQADALKAPWMHMLHAAETVKKTHVLGKDVPQSFSVKLQRRLASTMPPRPIVQPGFDEAMERWLRFCKDGSGAIDILRYADTQSTLNFVLLFQSQKPQPLVFIRTVMQKLLFEENIILGSHSIRRILDDDLALLVLPASPLLDRLNDEVEAVQDPRFIVARHMEAFRQRAFPDYLGLLRTLCQNRSRTRRMLCRAIQAWDRLQFDAEEADQLIHKAITESKHGATYFAGFDGDALPLSSWVFFYKLRIMEWVVQFGFELETYQPDELAGMYWYQCYLAKRRVEHVERIRSFTMRVVQHQKALAKADKTALRPDEQAAYTRSLLFLRTTMLDVSVRWEIADALSCLYVALQRTGAMPVPSRPFGTDALRYELRMRPFAAVGHPELPPFETFAADKQQTDSAVAQVLAYAENAISAAKKGCEAITRLDEHTEAFAAHCHDRWIAEAKGVHKAAIFAGIAVATTQKALAKAGTPAAQPGSGGGSHSSTASDPILKLTVQVPTPDKSYHEWWIVPKVSPAP